MKAVYNQLIIETGNFRTAVICTASGKNISKENYPFGGGSGAGVTVKPVAFLVVNGNSIKLIPVDQVNSSDKIVEAIPQVLEMIKSLGKKNKEEKED